jgi:hypothetical protein
MLELFEWIVDGIAGWRYLLSPSFRRSTHERWKSAGWGTALVEIFFGALAVLFTLLLVGIVPWLVFS